VSRRLSQRVRRRSRSCSDDLTVRPVLAAARLVTKRGGTPMRCHAAGVGFPGRWA
jgi:hypothetical protein